MVDEARIADFIRRSLELRRRVARNMAATCLEMASSAKTADSRAKFAAKAVECRARADDIAAQLKALPKS